MDDMMILYRPQCVCVSMVVSIAFGFTSFLGPLSKYPSDAFLL